MLTAEQAEKAKKVEQSILDFTGLCWRNFARYEQKHGGNPIKVFLLEKSQTASFLLDYTLQSFDAGALSEQFPRVQGLIKELRQTRNFFEEYVYSPSEPIADARPLLSAIDSILEATHELSEILPRS